MPSKNSNSTEPADGIARALADLRVSNVSRRQQALDELAESEPADDRRPEVVKAILTEMLADNKSISDAAYKGLVRWGNRESVQHAIEMLRARDRWDATNLMKFLAQYPDEQTADAIAERLRNDLDGKAAQALLCGMGKSAEMALIKVIGKRDPWAADRALDTLSSMFDSHQPTAETRDMLIQFVKKENGPRQEKAIIALGGIKDEVSAEAVAEQLGDFSRCHTAGQALCRMGSISEKFVVKQLKNDNTFVRAEACRVLGVIGTRKSIFAVQALTRDFHSGQDARQAIESINRRMNAKTP